MPRRVIDLAGRKFGRLTVLCRIPREQQHYSQAEWKCRCDCGEMTTVLSQSLRSGTTSSCGCYRREVSRENSFANRVRRGTLTRWTNRRGVTSVVQPDGTIRRYGRTGHELSSRRVPR